MVIKPINQKKFRIIFQRVSDFDFIKNELEKNKKIIFGKKGTILDLKIKIIRAYWLNKQRLHKFVIKYKIKFKPLEGRSRIFNIYAKAQDNLKQDDVLKILNILLNKGFKKGTFRVQIPIMSSEEGMVLFYYELKGEEFLNYFKDSSLPVLRKYIKKLAQLITKLHQIKFNNYFSIPSNEVIIKQNKTWVRKNIISLEKTLKLKNFRKKFLPLYDSLLSNIQKIIKPCLLHNDFAPDNIIINENYIGLLDFSIYKFADPAEELASFMTRLIMIAEKIPHKTYGHLNLSLKTAEELNKLFLEEYIKKNNLDDNFKFKVFLYISIYLLGFAQYTLNFENNKKGAQILINKAKAYARGFNNFAHL